MTHGSYRTRTYQLGLRNSGHDVIIIVDVWFEVVATDAHIQPRYNALLKAI